VKTRDAYPGAAAAPASKPGGVASSQRAPNNTLGTRTESRVDALKRQQPAYL